MRFFGLKSCDTCRKARKALEAAGYSLSVIDVRADGVSEDDRASILAEFGETALNKSSTTWRALSDEDKARDVGILLATYPTLMKRPVIVHEGKWTIGWKPDVQATYLGD